MASEFPTLESQASLPDEVIGSLARNLLLSFFATYGAGCQERFHEEEGFRQLLWGQCVNTLGVVAAVMSLQDDRVATQGIAFETIANAVHDLPEVAALRVFTFTNMVPKEALADPTIEARVRWFLDGYRRNRGEALQVAGH